MSRSLKDIVSDGRYTNNTKQEKIVEWLVAEGMPSKLSDEVKEAMGILMKDVVEEDTETVKLADKILLRADKDWWDKNATDIEQYLAIILKSQLFKGTSRKVKREITSLQNKVIEYKNLRRGNYEQEKE